MKLLLDENLPHRLRPLLVGHDAYTVKYMTWDGTRNGRLLAQAAAAGFDAVLTMDSGIEYEQNLATLPCSVVILSAESNALDHLKPLLPAILKTLSTLTPRTLTRIP